MSIIKNEIPILEYDADKQSVIMPDHEHLTMRLPAKGVFAFLGDAVDQYAKAHNAEIAGEFISITKKYPVYVVRYGKEEICLVQAPVGAPAAAQILDWLISYGVTEIISSGSCGVLTKMEENVFLVPSRALRDEGTSYHYLRPSRYVDINPKARKAVEKTLREHNLRYTEVMTWSTDGFFRETEEKVAYRKAEGCQVVEMECSALAAVAALRGGIFGQLLFTADTLADPGSYDERDWGENSFAPALTYSLEAVCRL